jgi:GMP reductase
MDTIGTFEMAKVLSRVSRRSPAFLSHNSPVFTPLLLVNSNSLNSTNTPLNSFVFQYALFTTIHKYYTADEWKDFASQNPKCLPNVAASSGIGNEDFTRLSNILATIPELSFICIDVANGYSQYFVEYVRKVRSVFPAHTIIVSNIKTLPLVFYMQNFFVFK